MDMQDICPLLSNQNLILGIMPQTLPVCEELRKFNAPILHSKKNRPRIRPLVGTLSAW